MKRLHRLIVLSETYRQSSIHPKQAEYAAVDAGNRLWWRAERRRLDAEALRDALLFAGGNLKLDRIGGPSFVPEIPPDALEGLSMKGAAWKPSPTDEFGRNCFIARRLVERGVRFVQLYSGGGHLEDTRDAHAGIESNHGLHAAEVDQPIAALLTDRDNWGLLKDTLVVWCGEFGRMPFSEGKNEPGRNHNPYGFSMWLAGGGVKGGVAYGATDELGFEAVENKVHIHDLHATILHLMGLDHEKLTYFHQGRHERLTDVYGNVVTGILT